MVDIVGHIIVVILFVWPVAATATDYFLNQPRPTEGGSMRVAHAERRSGGFDYPYIRNDIRGGVGIVLPMDSQAAERAPRQAGGYQRSLEREVSGDSAEGPIERLRGMLSMFKRCKALETSLDGMMQWLGERK